MVKYLKQKNIGRKALSKAKGYTIIETMIAVSLFITIIMAGMGTLLNANLVHKKSQNMRSIMDNLSFVLEDMSRNIRTGYNYHCFISTDTIPSGTDPVVSTPNSCPSGWALAFESATGSTGDHNDQWLYYISNGKIFKSTVGPYAASSFVQLTPDEVVINPISGFSVLGAEPISTNNQQPFVGIKLVGTVTLKNVVTPFSLQTSASQRLIDGSTIASAQTSYRYIRWLVTKRKGAGNSIQVAELVLLQGGSNVSWPGGTVATNPGGSNPVGEGPTQVIDNNIATKWLDFNFASGGALVGSSQLDIDTGVGNTVTFNGYKWATANDSPERDPVSWTISGSNNGSSWTVLDTKVDQTITDTRQVYTSNYSF